MHNKKHQQNIMGATIKQIIVAFVYIIIVFAVVCIFFSNTISKVFSIIDIISINTNKRILSDVKIDLATKNLKNYPEYGSKYGTISIPSLDIELPIYFGDTLEILKYGVGHSSLSYFPGEGGSILCMGHNTAKYLKKLPKIKNEDKILIETSYGKYTYNVYDTKIVYQTELEAAPIQREKEILMLYTCYPVDGIGHAVNRFFVYANLEKEELF